MRLLIAVCCFLWIPLPLGAAETIRVALIQDVSQATLTSGDRFFIKTVSGERVGDQPLSSAEITILRGLAVNGRDSFETELLFIPRRGAVMALNGRAYQGSFRVKKKNGGLLVVNEVDLERYLQGVVPAEMSPKWEMEALKTQAVISRTYALYQRQERAGRDFDLAGSVLGQVYNGESAGDRRADSAIEQTRGMVLTYQGELVLSFFHSTSAGPTEDASERWDIDRPYLKGVSCPLDRDSPHYHWERPIALQAVEEGLRKIGYPLETIATLSPLQWSRAGRLLTVRILHSGGELILKAEELRKALGYQALPSTHFKIDSFGKELLFSGMGYGHGVGLCQWGAKVMAERGLKFEEILRYYYPGVKLQPYKEIK